METEVVFKKPIKERPEFAGILREEQAFATGVNEQSVSEQINSSFDRLMVQSGLEMSPSMLLMLSFCSAIGFAGLAFVIQENMMTTGIAAAVGAIVPVIYALITRSRRQSEILKQMPGMVDELARASRTGRSLEQCFEIVAEDTPSPLGDELQTSLRKMQLGASMPSALKDLPERTGIVSLNVFVTALSVHHQTGGDVVTVLERLSSTIRDRISFLGRLKAATVGSRATAILMLSVPPVVILFLVFRDPEYLNDLMDAKWGRISLMTAIILQVVGTAWILKILQSSKRT